MAMDFSGVFLGLSVAQAVAAIVGAGTVLALPLFGRWCVEKIAGFFEDREDLDADDHADDEAGEADEVVCGDTGHDYDGGECVYCGAPEKGD
ncbi:TPA: hypothetical protein UON56_000075 [Stenotrophomonas maltophilia]|uniref:Uncharacterized protein n=2 Tax=Stenotrophomonas maltophilia TaxID=40324 RepID=A0AAI9CHF0_STEMA|nr:hypothetical protein [Stenotrophomonas maltophilia]EKT2104045.1 hypothetical protein [Stenotrophomonas maltophilia]EKZ1925132.1 hypothetical protein [Stenotrophomonas maltophilia]EMB2743730.1 hypothetical protein [Stenotrophomonas maltophilia]EMB2748126.1 hypothetical protein [Stenotrophomonas maltophilia]MBH1422239.1 hypothetical protein [Stenotrophomonas maltophilia]